MINQQVDTSETVTGSRGRERLAVLQDGARVRVRLIRPDDADRIVNFFGRLSPQTVYQRFFSYMKRLPAGWAERLATADSCRRLALVADRATPLGFELIGVGSYEPTEREGLVEVALLVADDWQGKGLGTILIKDLMRAADASGIECFRATVLADNDRMLRLLSRLTDIQRRRTERGVVEVIFSHSSRHARTPGKVVPCAESAESVSSCHGQARNTIRLPSRHCHLRRAPSSSLINSRGGEGTGRSRKMMWSPPL
jgi:RimJ/RimL family protein N-acetyltransferase